MVGMSLPNNYLVHNSSISNLARGVLTRVLLVKGKPTPKPTIGSYSRLRLFRNLLVRRFSSTTPVDRQEFVETYGGRRKVLYQQAADSLLSSSIVREDANIKAFVKAEFINMDDKPDPDPRVISPRSPRYNVEVGRYLIPVEKKLYAAIAHIFGEPTVMKGFNAHQIGRIFKDKWSRYHRPVGIGLDASRFDQHVSVDALKWEHSIYNQIYNSKELAKLLSWQLRNKVVGYCKDGKLKYTTDGCRMSGDMNTSLGNCLIMCALVHAYLAHRGIKGSLANNGDDCMVIMESRDLSGFQVGLEEWFLEMGFSMKVEKPVYELEGVEFCQTHPVYDGEKYIMVRNFPQAISKDCLSMKIMSSPRVCKAWLGAVGQGGMSLTGGIPVYQEFYSSLIRAGAGISEQRNKNHSSTVRRRSTEDMLSGGMNWLSKGMTRTYRPVSPEARHSFYLAFGTTPDEQCALERVYQDVSWTNRLESFGRLIHLPKWG